MSCTKTFLGVGAVLAIGVVFAWAALFRPGKIPVVVFGESAPQNTKPASPAESELKVAVGSMISPTITRQYYDEILQLVGRKIGTRVVLSQRRTYAEINAMLEARELDLAFVCSGPYVLGHTKFGMEILAVPVVNGKMVYYSYILAGKESPYHSFADLKGKKFAFTDPDSNTGCLVPRFMLAKLQQTPESYFSETFFTQSHDNSIRAVAEGMADGAAVDSLIWEFMNATDPTYTSRTKIIEKSPPYGIPPIVVHPALAPEKKQKLKEIFLSMHKDPAGAELLARLKIERFEEGDDSMYDSVREMQKWLDGGKK